MASVSPTMFNLTPHRLLPYRTNSNNKLTTLLQHQALFMVSLQLQRQNQHVPIGDGKAQVGIESAISMRLDTS